MAEDTSRTRWNRLPSSDRRPRQRGPRGASNDVLVIGLGRFGSSLAEELVALGHEVMGVDADPAVVQTYATALSHAVAADSTDVRALRQLGADEFGRAVVAIGTNVEASILTTAALADLGIKEIWAKAVTEAHSRILERVGAHHVVSPEHDMGRRVAHVVGGGILDYMQLDDSFALVETWPPRELVGRTLGQADVRARYEVTIVCIKPAGKSFTYTTPETLVREDDILLVAGEKSRAEEFARRSL